MKKKSCMLLFALGGFLVTTGLLSRAWVYPRVAVIPTAADMRVVAVTDGPAEYFDLSQLKVVHKPLQQTVVIRGDAALSAKVSDTLHRDVAVWHQYSCTDVQGADCLANRYPLAATDTLTALDAHTAVTVPWRESYLKTGGTTQMNPPAGYSSIKFPFQTTKNPQPMWDSDLQKEVAMHYAGTTTYDGLDVYRFDQTIAPTKLGTMQVPGSIVGSTKKNVTVDRMYSSHREYTVEPTTGVIIGRQESPDSYLALHGTRVLTLIKGTFNVDKKTMDDTAAEYKTLALELKLVRTGVPIAGVTIGLLCLALGFILYRRRAGARTSRALTRPADSTPPGPADHLDAGTPSLAERR